MKKLAVEFTLNAKKCDFPIEKIRCSKDAADFAKKMYPDDINIYESVYIILTNQAGNTIGFAKISQGGISSTLIDIRLVAKYSIEALATGVILVHNHPSGNLNPSVEDSNITSRLKKALELLNIRLLDSIIIADSDNYYSFSDEGFI